MGVKISVVIACHGPATDLSVILGTLAHQRKMVEGTTPKGKKIEWLSGPHLPFSDHEIIICSDGRYEGPAPGSIFQPVTVIECPKEGGVGHHTREPGIKAAQGDWIMLTNADNLFTSGWLSRVLDTLEDEGGYSQVGMLYWGCLSNLWSWSDFGGSKLMRGHIDLSCALVRADIAKRIGFPYREYDGDFDYIKLCASRSERVGLKVVGLKDVLVVHN